MNSAPRLPWLIRRLITVIVAILIGSAGLLAMPGSSRAATSLPCDIYGAAGTPCVAAYSTVRALYSGYDGPLYQVRRVFDGTTANVGLLAAGGYANATQQDVFCAHTTCVITWSPRPPRWFSPTTRSTRPNNGFISLISR
jgi:non-reducing end alpha-L-arabinofuranosidase